MRRSLAAAALMASLMNPWTGILDPLWSFLSSLGNAPVTKEGCGADPDGRCRPVPPPSTDAGAGWDPFG